MRLRINQGKPLRNLGDHFVHVLDIGAEHQILACPFGQMLFKNLVQPLVRTNKAQYDAWEGYGDVLDAVEPDAVSGATVSTSNITSVIKGLFQYHADKYYK